MGGSVIAEDEIDGGDHAEAGPKEVGFDFLFHIEDGEGHENQQGDDFLEDFQVGDAEGGVADTVSGDLDQVFEEGDAPANNGGDEPGLGGEVFKMPIPCEGHKDVGKGQHDRGQQDGFHKYFHLRRLAYQRSI